MNFRNSYLDLLDEMWGTHLLPKPDSFPAVISLFAGCGGSSLGYSMAGFRELLAVEWGNHAVEVFRLNFPNVPVFHDDIAKLSIDRCLQLSGIQSGELDILDGSPPCQGFSTAGKRQLSDGRNQLFYEYVRLLEGLKPKVFVMENVSGLIKGKMKLIFAEMIKSLKGCGYHVSARLLNAMYFHVPQSRGRIIFIGIRNDLEIEPSHPSPESYPLSAKEAIPGLIATQSQHINPWIDAKKSAATICKTGFGYPSKFQMKSKDLKEAEIRTSWQAYRVLTGQERNKHFGLVRLNPNKPSPTIMKDTGNTTAGLIHPVEIRKLTVPEIKRLSSFPDDFRMRGNFKQKWACIGNSVPPLMMEAIARHIKTHILFGKDE